MRMRKKKAEGRLLVISGPAGSGKGTVIKALMDGDERFSYSVSATTRAPRPGEIDGVNYYFITRSEFEKRISRGRMVEYTEYCGNYYGTPADELKKALKKGKIFILEIEVNGASNIRRQFPDATMIMIVPPDFRSLEARLRGRGTETEESIEKRLETSRKELACLGLFDYIVINRDGAPEEASETVRGIVSGMDSEKYRVSNNPDFAERFFGTGSQNVIEESDLDIERKSEKL